MITTALCAACFQSSRAQVLPGIEKDFAAYQKSNLQEKIYVHLNKSLYLTGELMWFKAYCVSGADNKLLGISKVAYVELLNNNHAPVMQTKIALNGGTGNGSLFIPFSLNSGNYLLRAYTNRMKNFAPDYFFERILTIVNPLKSFPAQVRPGGKGYDVQFFPEGGHLVQGLESRVAFKVTGSDGSGQPCTGAIINQQNDTVVHFKTLKFGI